MKTAIFKNTEHKTATFVILEPDTVDRNGDAISENEIVKTAHEFVQNITKKAINVNHEKHTDRDDVKIVESFILPLDIGEVKKWSWLVALKFLSDELWDKLNNGEMTGVSMEWFWYYE